VQVVVVAGLFLDGGLIIGEIRNIDNVVFAVIVAIAGGSRAAVVGLVGGPAPFAVGLDGDLVGTFWYGVENFLRVLVYG